MQVSPARAQERRGFLFDGGFRRIFLRCELDQPELDVVDRQRLFCRSVEALQCLRGARSVRARAGQRELTATMCNRDVERGLDLAQVRVERPAQVRERAVVERRQRERVPLAPGSHAPAAI